MTVNSSLATTTSSGWEAQLDLSFSHRADKTVLSKREQRGPLAVQRAFYPEGDVCHLYILHPPGGVVGGDRLFISAHIESDASSLLTTPGATKFYKSQGLTAFQQQSLSVEKSATLEWLPQENIYFPGAQAHMRTQIDLAEDARFIGWETHCLGLPVNKQSFSTGSLQLDFMLTRDQRPVLIEKMKVQADRLTAPAGLRGNSVMAMLVATPADDSMLESVRELLDNGEQILIAATLIEDTLLLRYLGNSTEQCRKLFTQIWITLRPLILDRKACPPRIWAT
jgi:urease accessory protein